MFYQNAQINLEQNLKKDEISLFDYISILKKNLFSGQVVVNLKIRIQIIGVKTKLRMITKNMQSIQRYSFPLNRLYGLWFHIDHPPAWELNAVVNVFFSKHYSVSKRFLGYPNAKASHYLSQNNSTLDFFTQLPYFI